MERSDGGLTQATTTVPSAPPTITYDDAFFLPCAPEGNEVLNSFRVTIEGVPNNHLAALSVIYDGGSMTFALDHLDDAEFMTNVYEAPINYRTDIFQIPTVGSPMAPCTGRHRPQYALIAAAAGGPNWPNFGEASLNELARPDTFSNVENGHGLFEGVYSDTVRINSQDRPPG